MTHQSINTKGLFGRGVLGERRGREGKVYGHALPCLGDKKNKGKV